MDLCQHPRPKCHHDPDWQCRSLRSAWTQWLRGPRMPTRPQGPCQIPGSLTTLNGNKNLEHHHRPDCGWATDPGMAPATARSRWCHGPGWECHSGLYSLSSSTALEYELCHRWQPRYWSFVYPLVATWVTDINPDPGYSRTTVPDSRPQLQSMARCDHGPSLPHRSHRLTWPKNFSLWSLIITSARCSKKADQGRGGQSTASGAWLVCVDVLPADPCAVLKDWVVLRGETSQIVPVKLPYSLEN